MTTAMAKCNSELIQATQHTDSLLIMIPQFCIYKTDRVINFMGGYNLRPT